MEARSAVFVHAHPDDETLLTGGTIARLLAGGARVTVVTCTLGEEGEVIGDRYQRLVAQQADQLGGYRIAELSAALTELSRGLPGQLHHEFLGGAGRWRDSGMVGTASTVNPRAFINCDFDAAVAALIAIIDKAEPEVIVGYDPIGGYGHPDHIQVHHVTTAAVRKLAGTDRRIEHYWAMGPSRSRGDTEVDVTAFLDRKLAALRAHATQVTVAADGTQYALSNNIAQPVLNHENFVHVADESGDSR